MTLCLALAPVGGYGASFVLITADPPGVGFNDPTPVAPVGGNTGTTLGQQRINVFIRAVQRWGAELNSNVAIRIEASWPALPCSATSAVLGSTLVPFLVANTPGVLPGFWYPVTLGDKLANLDLLPEEPDIVAFFNRNLGQPGCVPGLFYYLGLDGNTPPNTVDLLETLLHELGHGFGFQTTTDKTTGEFCCTGLLLPSIYDRYLLDKTTGLHWNVMSNAQRAASAINNAGQLVWDGPLAVASVPVVLGPAAEVKVTAPASAAHTFIGGPSQFGPSLATPVSGELMPVTASGGVACDPLAGLDALAVSGKVALINRGVCPFLTKVRNAQNAGATGVIIANNIPGAPPSNLNGIDPAITIPSAMVTQPDGSTLRNLVRFRSRTNSGVFVRLGQSLAFRAGADAANRIFMYAPNPVQPGSSISHWDVSAFPNLLMEPADTPETDLSVKPPGDLTLQLLQEIGW